MKFILDESNAEHFTPEYPLFYKNKMPKINNKEKFFYRSAIDSALRTNQTSAIEVIIEYIIKYQNNYVSSFLFKNNFIELVEKGLELSCLIEANVFRFSFDYDEWPSTHSDEKTYLRPFNGSLFDIRTQYRNIFPEPHMADM
jgi:hypothetical protein